MGKYRSMFKRAKDVRVSQDYIWEKPGRYIEAIVVCKKDEDRKGIGRVVIQKRVIAVIDTGNNPGSAHNVGDLVTVMISQKSDYFVASLKKLVMTAFDLQDYQIGTELLDHVFDDEDPLLCGLLIERESKNTTGNDGKTYVRSSYLSRKFTDDLEGCIEPKALQKMLDTKRPSKLIDREIDLSEFLEDDEDEEPVSTRRKKSKRRSDDDYDDEDEPKRSKSRRRADEEDEEEQPRRRRRRRRDDEDED